MAVRKQQRAAELKAAAAAEAEAVEVKHQERQRQAAEDLVFWQQQQQAVVDEAVRHELQELRALVRVLQQQAAEANARRQEQQQAAEEEEALHERQQLQRQQLQQEHQQRQQEQQQLLQQQLLQRQQEQQQRQQAAEEEEFRRQLQQQQVAAEAVAAEVLRQERQRQAAEEEAAAQETAAAAAAEAMQATVTIMEAVHALLQVTSADVEPPNIPFSLLEQWTEGFAESRLVGSGGFGNVYRGEYADNTRLYGRVAVKRVNQELVGVESAFQQQSVQGGAVASMRREIAVLHAFKHPNIIKLLGFHLPEGGDLNDNLNNMCLVYEMASNGSLDRWLTEDDKAARLGWRQRTQIAVGIATALNYLHCHNRGHPAYHRDVKSANIALTIDFCPKLLDCGLAKFIPAGGAPTQTVFTRTGQVFGTPGYMCHQYVNSGVYDAKSEVYAFGIVLAELYGGKLQNQDGVIISDEALDEGDIAPDARIIGAGYDPFPAAFLSQWKALSVNSLKSHRKRVPAMMTVLRELRNLSTMGGVSVTAAQAEDELNRLRRELEEMRLKETVEQRLQREDTLRCQRKCLVCYDDDCRLAGGVECSQGHFVCDECFRGDSLAHQLSVENRGNFKNHGLKLVCQWCRPGPPVHVFQDNVAAAHLGAEAFGRYLAVRAEVMSVEVSRNAEATCQVRLEAMRLALGEGCDQRVARHRSHIAEDILTLKCPRVGCRQAILDFDGCFAITCSNCQCGFCGWCLVDCGDDAHQHVLQCPSVPANHQGGYYGTQEEFIAVHVERRRGEVARYLLEQVRDEDFDRVMQAIGMDLEAIGIRLEMI